MTPERAAAPARTGAVEQAAEEISHRQGSTPVSQPLACATAHALAIAVTS